MAAPNGLRLGGLTDGYGVLGSKDASGLTDPNVAAFDSAKVIGTLLLRCWGDVFTKPRDVTDMRVAFREPIDYAV